MRRARAEFPAPVRDRDAFERFLRSRLRVRLSLEFRGKQESWESTLYKWMRCELVHEGGLPADLRFMEDAEPGELSARAGGAPEYVVLVSPGWFDQLARDLANGSKHMLVSRPSVDGAATVAREYAGEAAQPEARP